METVNVEDAIYVLKNDKDLISNWERLLSNMQLKSIQETSLKKDFDQTRDGAQLVRAIVTQWVLEKGNAATVENLGRMLKTSGHASLRYKLETTFQPAYVITTQSVAISYPGCLEILLQNINWTPGGGKEECQIFLPKLLTLLSNIGARPVTIISVHGNHSLYNTILKNGMMKHLKFGCRNESAGIESEPFSTAVELESASEIRIWNEPFYVCSNGNEIGVIVMEQNGSNPITTAFSLLLSSVCIFLENSAGGEQVIQWFNQFVSANEPKTYPMKLYQNLTIILKTVTTLSPQQSANEIMRLKTEFLKESMKQLSTGLDKYFQGINFDIIGTPVNLSNELTRYSTSFGKYFEKQFSPENLENSVKQVSGKQQTGYSLKDFACLWAQLVVTSKETIRPKTIQFETEKMFISNMASKQLEKYRKCVEEILRNNPSLTESKFETLHLRCEETLRNELMSIPASKSTKDDCKNMWTINTATLKHNFISQIHRKPKPENVDISTDNSQSILPMPDNSIQYDENQELGRGSKETIVYKGTFGDRPVAVKRLNRVYFDIKKAKQEVDFLIKCDSHPNVVQLFHGKEGIDCYLIALELCHFTLENWVKKDKVLDDFVAQWDAKEILLQTTEGLAHLHRKRIIHRDIKPQNILLHCDQTTKTLGVKISDFGISKYLAENRSSADITSCLGSDGWVAPEILQYAANASSPPTGKLTMESDVFSLGCVFYYVLTKGEHPFGDAIRRQTNILDGKVDLNKDLLKRNGVAEAECLIKLMLSIKPKGRPPVSAITKHYLLWTPSKISSFLVSTNKCWEAKGYQECSAVKNYLEKWKWIVFNQQEEWGTQLDQQFQEYLQELQNAKRNVNKHNLSRVDDMIRLIRNIEMHQTEGKLPQHILNLLDLPVKYVVEYFTNKFPFLIPVAWLAFQGLKKVPAFKLKDYYPLDYDFDGEIGAQLGLSRQSKGRREQKHTERSHNGAN